METPFQGVISTLGQLWNATLIVVVVFMTSHPAPALAFVSQINEAANPLLFPQDPSLADTAIVGIEMWPPHASIDPRHQYIWRNSSNWQTGRKISVVATAYSSTPEETDNDPFTTASGTHVHPGTLAANFLPFGAQVRINNTDYIVEDRLHPRYNNRLVVDIWHESRPAAIQFGVQVVTLEIVSLP